MSVAAAVEARVRAGGLLEAGAPVLVLLSGGRDSVCLLDLAVRLGCETAALHVDHGLRAGSAEDAAFCADLCSDLRVELTVSHAGKLDGGNVQAWARERRYGAARELASPRAAAIATGHTATDRAETVLYRLATSGGVNAVPALPAAAPPFYRPLLDLSRDDVREELARRGLEWRVDASNDDPAFARNRIRNEALPVLLALNPRADANIARTAELAAAERELLASLAAPFVSDGAADLRFRDKHVALQREVVRQAAAAAGVTVQHADVEALIGPGGVSRRTLPGGAEAVTVGGWLKFSLPS